MNRLPIICAAFAVLTAFAEPARADLTSYARVLDDGSLSLNGRLVRLHGVSIPPTDRVCNSTDMPGACGPRSILQLSRKIGPEFVHCRDLGRDDAGAMLGRCSVLGEDLGGWMVLNGWAMAGADAPFEYVQWERLAESRRVGIWGQPVDAVVRPPPRRRPPPTHPPTKPGS